MVTFFGIRDVIFGNSVMGLVLALKKTFDVLFKPLKGRILAFLLVGTRNPNGVKNSRFPEATPPTLHL